MLPAEEGRVSQAMDGAGLKKQRKPPCENGTFSGSTKSYLHFLSKETKSRLAFLLRERRVSRDKKVFPLLFETFRKDRAVKAGAWLKPRCFQTRRIRGLFPLKFPSLQTARETPDRAPAGQFALDPEQSPSPIRC